MSVCPSIFQRGENYSVCLLGQLAGNWLHPVLAVSLQWPRPATLGSSSSSYSCSSSLLLLLLFSSFSCSSSLSLSLRTSSKKATRLSICLFPPCLLEPWCLVTFGQRPPSYNCKIRKQHLTTLQWSRTNLNNIPRSAKKKGSYCTQTK